MIVPAGYEQMTDDEIRSAYRGMGGYDDGVIDLMVDVLRGRYDGPPLE